VCYIFWGLITSCLETAQLTTSVLIFKMKAVKGECCIAFKALGCGTLGVRVGGGMEEWSVILCSKKWLYQKKNVWRNIHVITWGWGGTRVVQVVLCKISAVV